ncbi:DUF695 domain-containing protein [Pontibacter arcticus]|nr:DUF695 domain-containing protein [Pontibacter arcticus]
MSQHHTPAWEVYFCHIEEFPAFVSTDLGVATVAPLKDKPNLIEVVVALKTTDETGFPEAEEWHMLEKIEDTLVQLLEAKLNVTFVGKTLYSGKRSFYFYGDRILLLDGYVSEVMEKYPDYMLLAQATEDPDWNIYFGFLYPDAESMQRIRNSQMLQLMEEQGDQPFVPRKITHWLYFKTASGRDATWKALQQQNFKLEERAQRTDTQKGLEYKLVVYRDDKADEESIEEISSILWQLASQQNGEYDGWEALTIPENA